MRKSNDKLLILAGIAVVGVVGYEMLKPKTVTAPVTPTAYPTGYPTGMTATTSPLSGVTQSILTGLLGSGGQQGISTVASWLSSLFGSGSSYTSSAGSNVADPTYNGSYVPPGANDYPGIDLSSQDMLA